MKIFLAILIPFLISIHKPFGGDDDCSSIKIFESVVDDTLQKLVESFPFENVLLINHCNSTNGCNGWGMVYWEHNGKSHLRRLESKNGKVRASKITKGKWTKHVKKFMDKKLWEQTEKIDYQDSVWLSHTPITKIYFKKNGTAWCFNLAHESTLKVPHKTDERVQWVMELRKL